MMRSRVLTFVGLCVAFTLAVPTLSVLAAGDKPTAGEKPDAEKKVEMLFVQSAKSASLTGSKLTLKGISPTTIFFSDRPSRIAGHLATEEMIPLWSEGKDSFAKEPPNATLSAFTSDGKVVNAVVELKTPSLSHDEMTYEVRVLEGKVPPNADGVSLFIDIIGMPLTPLSFAGVARRAYRRSVILR